MRYHVTLSEIAEVRLLVSMFPIFLQIEDAKNRTFSVVIQVYNIVESTVSIIMKFLAWNIPTCASL